MKKNILIYRDVLLSYSETFIPAQAESLSDYHPIYLGIIRNSTGAMLIPENRQLILNDVKPFPKLWRLLFKFNGVINPGWLQSIKQYNPELIHAHFGLGGVWCLPLAKKLKIPLITTFHGYDLTINENKKNTPISQNYQYKLYLKRLPQLFTEGQVCIAVSQFIYQKLLAKGCPEDKAILHYTGIDIEQFTPKPEIKRDKTVLFVGRLVEKKGCKYLIEAMAKVQQKIPDAALVIIGDGELKNELEEQAQHSLKNYSFLGKQPLSVVKTFMNKATVMAVPSITASTGDMEGLPTVIMEAQAMGLPVIGSIHSGIPEIIIHDKTGFLIPEKDWERLAHYLLILLENKQVQRDFIQAGYQQVKNKFNLKKNTEKLQIIYQEMIEKYNHNN